MQQINKVDKWLSVQKKKIYYSVKIKNLFKLTKWHVSKNNIAHASKKFFKVVGINVKTNFYKNKVWDQPLILQKEKGILGILKRKNKMDFEYLFQAKFEPGNINKIQLSPTVQATKSNYTRVHKGKIVRYLNFFKRPKKNQILINSQQPEQGGRYLFKFNNNIIINVKKKIKLEKNYIWLNKIDICKLANKNNFLNMDSLSVLSCSIKKNTFDLPENSLKKINEWYKKLNKKYFMKVKIIPLSSLKNWIWNNKSIYHKSKKYFSIIGIKVLSNSREVKKWEQPIIQENSIGLSGFIIKKINYTYHYLVGFSLKPGLKYPSLSCTVRTSNFKDCLKNKDYMSIDKFYLKNYFINNSNGIVRYNKIQSDEGGRFFQSQTKNMIVEIPSNKIIKINKNYTWLSHNQILHFIKKGIFTIEARVLFTCFNMKNIL